MFETAIACEVFGLDRTDDGVPPFTFRMCGETAGVPVPTTSGGALVPTHQWQDALDADLVVMPAGGVRDSYPEELLDVIRAAHARGATILSICTGAFILAETGLLDGLTAVTHWRYAEQFAPRFPRTEVSMDVLYVDHGSIVTGAGTAAGIDAVLHLVRRELGCRPSRPGSPGAWWCRRSATAASVSTSRRRCRRPTARASSRCSTTSPQHLDAAHAVPELARLAMMSERTFARRFVKETGTTPHKWVVQQRVLRARELLEQTDLPVDAVAAHSGFGSAALLRSHFQTVVGTSPQRYRREFSAR